MSESGTTNACNLPTVFVNEYVETLKRKLINISLWRDTYRGLKVESGYPIGFLVLSTTGFVWTAMR